MDSTDRKGEDKLTEPSIILREIRVRNFRAIEDMWLSLNQTTLLLGENNSGKTSILDAVGIALGKRGSPNDLRVLPDGSREEEFVIDARLEPRTTLEFDESVAAWATSAIRIPDDAAQPQYLVLRVVGSHNALQDRIDDKRSFLNRWQRDSEDGDAPEAITRPLIPRELRESLLFQLIDTRRDVAEELRVRSSFWGRLVGDLDLDEELAHSVFSELSDIGKRIVSGSEVLSAVQRHIQRSVDTLAPAAGEVGLKPLPTVTDSLARSMDVVVSAPASPEISLGRQGMGARSLAVLMIFQAFAQRRLAQRSNSPTLSVTAFEEPEAHLHPHASRSVFPLVTSVPGQRLISTHSTNVAGASSLRDVRVMRRSGAQLTSHWLSDKTIDGIKKNPVVEKLVMLRQGDVLFARTVILVEGETEARMLRPFFGAMFDAKLPEECGVTIVDMEGAQSLKHFALVVESFGGSWVTLIDGDAAGVEGVEAASKALGRSLNEASPEIIMLPEGKNMEEYILDLSFRDVLLSAIAGEFGDDALAEYREHLDGKPGRGKDVTRDYQSEGWEGRLLLDFLVGEKRAWGAAFGSECCAQKPALVPERIQALMTQTAVNLGVDHAGV